MKLNVGCSWPEGKYKRDEWINFDIETNRRVNVKGTALALPFANNSIEEVHCVHVLEHLPRDQYPKVLRELHRVIQPGKYVYVEVPDFMATVNNLQGSFINGDVEAIHVWTTSIYGKSERLGMSHYWGFYEGLLRREMRHQGFKDVIRLTEIDDMISTHYKQEPVLLVRGTK